MPVCAVCGLCRFIYYFLLFLVGSQFGKANARAEFPKSSIGRPFVICFAQMYSSRLCAPPAAMDGQQGPKKVGGEI